MNEIPQEFAKSFRNFMDKMSAAVPEEESELLAHMRRHFGNDPSRLPVVAHNFEVRDHCNVQKGLEAWAAGEGRSLEVIGVTEEHRGYHRVDLASIVTAQPGRGRGIGIGPVEYENVDVGEDRTIACIQSGLLLMRDGEVPVAALVQGPIKWGPGNHVSVQVMSATREGAERWLTSLRTAVRDHSVYRGRIISLDVDRDTRSLRVNFHRLPAVAREMIILPAGVLDRIERHSIQFSKHQQRLQEAGRHLKRGLLLHGPPGTGKTFTAMYLARRMEGRTVLLVTGLGQGLIEQTCAMARALEPATVILEDVDLIATSRSHQNLSCTSPLMFELLNQMDGLAEDLDVLFILTTNRPEVIEPALAARPGRIDQAIEVPLPDAQCRSRLLDLYGQGLTIRLTDRDAVVRRTEGASAAFMKELLRRSAVFAADRGEELVVTDREIDEAIHELAFTGGSLTRSLLGFGSGPVPGE